jgi:hypothetical protein
MVSLVISGLARQMRVSKVRIEYIASFLEVDGELSARETKAQFFRSADQSLNWRVVAGEVQHK